ncbi:MAG: LamB/YcsF family protein, partial [Proteobacteria bacterium]|nr:LamB/YcsF family protein [Pseudomonadota bacterium]
LMATEGVVIAVDGTRIPMSVDTLCVHGDNPSAVVLARTIRNRLEAAGVAVVPMAAHE